MPDASACTYQLSSRTYIFFKLSGEVGRFLAVSGLMNLKAFLLLGPYGINSENAAWRSARVAKAMYFIAFSLFCAPFGTT